MKNFIFGVLFSISCVAMAQTTGAVTIIQPVRPKSISVFKCNRNQYMPTINKLYGQGYVLKSTVIQQGTYESPTFYVVMELY